MDATSFTELSTKIGEDVEGLLKQTGRLRSSSVSNAEDVLGFDYIVHMNGGGCYEYYAANPPLIGMTHPVPVPCPVGLEIVGDYKVDYIKAVETFHTGNWGGKFTSIVLCKPLIYPEASEPCWYFRSDLGAQVVIGANTGKVLFPKI
jgi:hypothetical protein